MKLLLPILALSITATSYGDETQSPDTWIVISAATVDVEVPEIQLLEANSLNSGDEVLKGSLLFVKKDGVVYVLDRTSLGIELFDNIADSLIRASQSPIGKEGDLLRDAMMPMIWSPYRNKNVVRMAPIEVIPGYSLKLENDSDFKWFDVVKPNKTQAPESKGFEDISSIWKKGFVVENLYLSSVSISVAGNYPEYSVLRKLYSVAGELALDKYNEVRGKYNDAIDTFRQQKLNFSFPYQVGSFLEGKMLSELGSTYDKMQFELLDPRNPNKDWSSYKIAVARQEIYIGGSLQLADGSTENFRFQLPSKIR